MQKYWDMCLMLSRVMATAMGMVTATVMATVMGNTVMENMVTENQRTDVCGCGRRSGVNQCQLVKDARLDLLGGLTYFLTKIY